MQETQTIVLKLITRWVFVALGASAAWSSAQSPRPCSRAEVGQRTSCLACVTCKIVSEIYDLSTGLHWVLMRDSAHPGGPGVLVAEEFIQGNSRLEQSADRSHAVIRSGDRLTVEASSPVLDLRLEGIALSPAALGAQLRVRLVVSGKIVWAVALGPGRVAKESDTEIWQ